MLLSPTRDVLHFKQMSLTPIPTPATMMSGNTALKHYQAPFNFYWRPREVNFEGIDAVIRCGNEVWALQFTIGPTQHSAMEGLTQIYDLINHKRGVTWLLVMVSSTRSEAECARDSQKLADQ